MIVITSLAGAARGLDGNLSVEAKGQVRLPSLAGLYVLDLLMSSTFGRS